MYAIAFFITFLISSSLFFYSTTNCIHRTSIFASSTSDTFQMITIFNWIYIHLANFFTLPQLMHFSSSSLCLNTEIGLISLQKYGDPCPKISTKNRGSIITNTINIIYFNFLKFLSSLNVSIFLILSNSNTLQANSYCLLQFNSSRSMTISIVSHSHINKDNY